jgi:hypothetical protein
LTSKVLTLRVIFLPILINNQNNQYNDPINPSHFIPQQAVHLRSESSLGRPSHEPCVVVPDRDQPLAGRERKAARVMTEKVEEQDSVAGQE